MKKLEVAINFSDFEGPWDHTFYLCRSQEEKYCISHWLFNHKNFLKLLLMSVMQCLYGLLVN